MIKKIGFFVVMAAIIAAFGGCQKEELTDRQLTDEVQPQFVVNDPMFEGLSKIAFSVEDNRLVFENEEEFQKGIDFLANLGDKNFPAFEDVVGFNSYRKVYENDSVMSELFVDELYQVLLNPEKEVVVGNYLFREDPESEQTLAFEYDMENCSLKSSGISPVYTFSWNDDAFAIIKEEEDLGLKSAAGDYCDESNKEKHKYWYLKSSNYPTSDNGPYCYDVELKAKLCFQKTSIYKSIIAKIKADRWSDNCPQSPYCNNRLYLKVYFENIGKAIFQRKNRSKIEENVYEYEYISTVDQGPSWRPFYGTRRVICYNINMNFGYNIISGALPPQTYGESSSTVLSIQCNENLCQPSN